MKIDVNKCEEARNELEKRMRTGLSDFAVGLYYRGVNDAMKCAHEYAFKRDIVFAITDGAVFYVDTDDEEELGELYKKINCLLGMERPLDFLYHMWEEREETYMDRLIQCIEDSVSV